MKKEKIILIFPSSGLFGKAVLLALLEQELEKHHVAAAVEGIFIEMCGSRMDWSANALFLIGFSPIVSDVQQAQLLMGKLLTQNVTPHRIKKIQWNQHLPGGLQNEVLEKEGFLPDAVLPYDPGLLVGCENQGRQLAEAKPRAALIKAISELAINIASWVDSSIPSFDDGTKEDLDWGLIERSLTSRIWSSLANSHASDLTVPEMSDRIDQALRLFLAERKVPEGSAARIAGIRQKILDHVTGLGPLEEFFRDGAVNEVMVNGKDDIFVEKNGRIEKTSARFESDIHLRTVIERVVARVGRRVDLSSPLCDVRLPDGSRVNVVLPPLSLAGPVMTVRRFRSLYKSMDNLLSAETLNEKQAERLTRAIQNRENILIAGNSGAGKTTLLNVLAGIIPAHERILTLEDAAELQINQPHVVRLETRAKNAEGRGQINMADLLVNALRMRPDRLIIGECRGAEVIPMLQALNTGHDGSMTTLHANSAADAMKRLESLVLLHAPEWPVQVVREQIQAGLDTIVYLKRSGSERKVLEIVDVG